MKIPFLDFPRAYAEIAEETSAAIDRVLNRGVYILGREVETFEREWAQFCGVAGAAAVANGTDALTLALIASGAVRPGRDDEVITTPLTAGYTALAILNAGAKPVFADIDPDTFTIDPAALEKVITGRTRAIVPVHLYGQMCDMAAIRQTADSRGLIVIEDAAQAHGAKTQGKRAGAHGHAAAFSFYPTKNLGAFGDGGAVVSDDTDLIERVKLLRQGGHPPALKDSIAGRNSRLDEMQAAILRVKLKVLEQWNDRRRALAGIYHDALSRTGLKLPVENLAQLHVFHLYVIEHAERDRLRSHLSARGIETLIHYPFLLHQQPLFQSSSQPELPVAERAAKRILSLPLHPHLSRNEARAVADAILEFESSAKARAEA